MAPRLFRVACGVGPRRLTAAPAAQMKYPFLVDGVIAASAPILSFNGLDPAYDPDAYYSIVTRGARRHVFLHGRTRAQGEVRFPRQFGNARLRILGGR